ncbi:PRC-barrel domain-containing protein [Methylocapsa acidiphila]|uniref:PRC-barrel domain-containing protein n=1 Tax=Methylocapsa acidiphila TaxID=133552 RepID=UPI0003F58378|nr:PRC-barrel domain-containing protein [Methylocapsa acidiphila]
MFNKLALPAAFLALGASLAFAQSTMTKEPLSGRSVAAPASSLSTSRWLASDIYKANVYDKSERKIGDITDLVLNSDGAIKTAVIGVGGFLGAGQKDVAVPFKDIKISLRDGKDWLVLDRTKEDLKAAPDYMPAQRTGRSVSVPGSSLSTSNWTASDIYKADVYDNSEHKIGDVDDLVLNTDGAITTAVIGVGGFLGVGQKDVAIPFKELRIATRGGKSWLLLDRTKDQLRNAPGYDKNSEMDKM